MSFVVPILTGRLGNQMFEIATAIALAKDNNVPYYVPNIAGGASCYFNHFPLFKPEIHKVVNIHRENGHQYSRIQYKPSIKLEGYFQSEYYFKHHREFILDCFEIPYFENKGVVSLHVRRGDYLQHKIAFPPVKMEYYDKAIKHFSDLGYKSFLVFSDDIEWCKENFKQDVHFIFSEGLEPKEDMALMSGCEHNIISNSTFSWWGAWLNRNPNKVVISPSKYNWFGVRTRLNTDTIIPKEWIQIKF